MEVPAATAAPANSFNVVHLRAASMKPKSLQNSVSKRGRVVESFSLSAFEPVRVPFICAHKTNSKGFLGL